MGTQSENTHGIQTQTQPNPYPNFGSGPGITLGYPNFGYPIPTLVGIRGHLWVSKGIHGRLWASMGVCGHPLGSVGISGRQSVSMGVYGCIQAHFSITPKGRLISCCCQARRKSSLSRQLELRVHTVTFDGKQRACCKYISFSPCQWNLIKTFQIKALIAPFTKTVLICA